MNPKLLKFLETLQKATEGGAVQPQELIKISDTILSIVKSQGEKLEKSINDVDSDKESKINSLKGELETQGYKLNKAIEAVKTSSDKTLEKKVKELSKEIENVMLSIPEATDLTELENKIEAVRKEIPTIPEYEKFLLDDKGEQIVEEINALPADKDEYKIDAKHIKNLPDIDGRIRSIGVSNKYLAQLLDVDLSGLTYTNGKYVLGSGSGGGTFLDLTDTPSSYASQALKVVRVNAGEDALEFVTLAGGGDALTTDPLSQFAATTSAELAGVISDETGSGALVFGTSPTITTPTIGQINALVSGSNATTDVSANVTGNLQVTLDNTNTGGSTSITQMFKQGGTNRFQIQYTRNTLDTFLDTFNASSDIVVRPNSTEVIRFTPSNVNMTQQTADTIAIFDSSKNLISATTSTYPSLTELSYVKGVTSALQTQLDAKGAIAGQIWTGIHDFGGADSFEIVNGTAPTLDKLGEMALDTDVSDFIDGVLKFYGANGAVVGVIAMPESEFTSPTDGHVVAYNSTSDTFELVAQSGGISDGDKGDITVSGSGATWTIDNDVVTFAKMQNISTERLLGRTTASSGDIEEITAGNGLTLSGGSLAVDSASETVDGIAEIATVSEVNTGTDNGRIVSPDGLAGSYAGTKNENIYVLDASYLVTTGDGKAYFRIPSAYNGMNLVAVAASVATTSSSGNPTIMIARGRQSSATSAHSYVDMLSTAITIDATEYDSKDATTAAVINGSNDDVATGDLIRVDVDTAGTGTKGLWVSLEFRLP